VLILVARHLTDRILSIFSYLKRCDPQEKVEEDRYIRAREQQIAESRHRAAEAEAHAAELAAADQAKIAAKNAAMHEIADLLATTGDVVSEAGLANLAAWKHE
jgi:hypothetical protein